MEPPEEYKLSQPKKNKMDAIEKGKRLRGGPVYLLHDFEGIALRSVPEIEGFWYVRHPGRKEYKAIIAQTL